jgi:hypothetical protein
MGSEQRPLAPLLAALGDLLAWFRAEGIRGLIIGGVAASLLGRPRATRDVDALVLLDDDQWERFLASGASFGFVSRLSDPLAFAQRAHVFVLTHRPSAVDVDISLAGLPFEEEALERVANLQVEGLNVPLPTPEDLIIMKAVAHRARDVADIEAVLDTHPRLDLERVRRWVRTLAEAVETPELLEDLERLLSQRRGRKRRKRKS